MKHMPYIFCFKTDNGVVFEGVFVQKIKGKQSVAFMHFHFRYCDQTVKKAGIHQGKITYI